MLRIDWDAVRAYSSPFILTLLALIALWKDSKDYKRLAKEEKGRGAWWWIKRHAIVLIAIFTLGILGLTLLDIHSTRKQIAQDRADATADKKTQEKEIADLKAAVQSGNAVLTQQRQDFLGQFSSMSDKVGVLQAEVKTADLQEEATQLRSELESTRKSLEVPKATLSFSFWQGTGESPRFTTANMDNGAVTIKFAIANGSDTDALDGYVTLYACDQCKIINTSREFTKMDGVPDNQRNLDFQHIFANSRSQELEATIVPPPDVQSFDVAIQYRCRTCVLVRNRTTFPSNDIGTVLIGPHVRPGVWRQGKLPALTKLR